MERRLLDATERLMSEGASFTEISVDRLSTEAGISRASFYIYFDDKGHLLRRLAGQVFGDLAAGAERWWGVAWRHNADDMRAAMAGITQKNMSGSGPISPMHKPSAPNTKAR